MPFCMECGMNVPEGMKFCTGCGNLMDGAPQPVPVMAAAVEEAPQFAPPPPVAYTPPPYTPPPPPPQSYTRQAATIDSEVMSTGAFIGFSILFVIPVIGWLACIILSFAGGNLNRRNFARSRLFFMILGLVLSIALYFVLSWAFRSIIEYLNEISSGAFSESGGLQGIFEVLG